MSKRFLIILFALSLSVESIACALAIDTYTSVQDGNWDVAATWGNNGNDVPGFNDHVIISTGDSVFHTGNEIIGRLIIEPDAILQSNATLRVAESYVNDGSHLGTGVLRLVGNNDSIFGTGLLETSGVSRADGLRIIYPGSDFTIQNTTFRLPNSDTLINRGVLTMINSPFDGNGSGTVKNDISAILRTSSLDMINPAGGSLEASDLANTVIYDGTIAQNIELPLSSYYNLTLEGTGSVKSLQARTRVDQDLKVDGPTLSLVDTFSLVIGRDLDLVDGVFDAQNGRVEFVGTTDQDIKGNITFHDVLINNTGGGVEITQDTSRIQGQFRLSGGSFNTNDRMIVLSNAIGDGSIGPVTGGSISGDVVMQRYIDAGATNWRFLGSPTTNATFVDWNDDFITAGFPGSDFPTFNFTSILGYDETVLGFRDSGAVTVSITDNIPSGVGFWVYCGDSLGGTAPFTIDVTGPVYQGAMNFSVTYTGAFGDTDNGWNLLANPYPSAIDWDDPSWNLSNVDDAIYMWNSDQDQYSSYVGGVGTNNGNNIIPQGHGFYVKASNTPASISVDEAAKIDTTVAFLKPRRIDDLLVRLKIEQSGFSDETVIRSRAGSTSEFEGDYDAYHFPAGGRNPLQFFSTSETNHFTINTLNTLLEDTIPIMLTGEEATAALSYTIQNRGPLCLFLWDRTENILHSLDDEGFIELEIESQQVYHKYSLIVKSGLEDCNSLVGFESTPAVTSDQWVYYNGSRLVVLDQELQNDDYFLYGIQGNLVSTGRVSNGTIDRLPQASGIYLLKAGERTFRFVIP